MDSGNLVLLAIAGYVAAMSLVRLMRRRRDTLLQQFREQVEAERKRKRAETRRRMEAEFFGDPTP